MAEASEGRRQPAVVGLDVPFDETGRDKKRKVSKSMPIRCGPIWSTTVSIIANDKAYTTAPEVVCIDCGKSFVGGVTRIKTHLMKQCSCSTSELQELRAKLVLESEQHEEEKVKKKRIREVDAAANKEDPFRDKEGVFSKQSVLINAKRMAPAKWWKQYGTHLPLLSSVAQKVLAQVVCSSAAERNWSIYGRIKTKGRSQLGRSRADKLVYCHEAIHLKNKLQRASYTQLCEKWDTDSDSDSDVEEADLMA
ncbi:hypothetical protein AB1Y20_016509 [Prymnesium parvum]|uniref:HAT C-terminal dimerisation domain-containing protein n=1 Tax=Prymnesium parvum TaxID=97485 RepID=A0AB34ICZ8_PRYPA